MIETIGAATVAGRLVPPALLGELADSTHAPAAALAERLATHGYVLVRGAIDRGIVQDARAEVLARLAAVGEVAEPAIDGVATGTSRRGGLDLDAFWRAVSEGPALRRVTHGGALAALAARILGEPARPFDFLWLRAMVAGRASPLHFDHSYMNRGSARVLSAWVPLGDVAVEAGPIVFVEGSQGFAGLIAQHRGHDVDREPGYRGSLDEDAVTIAERYGTRLLTADFRAGDVVLFGMLTLHGSLDNAMAGNRIRLSCDVRYQPAGDARDERWFGSPPPGHGGKSYGGMNGAQPLGSAGMAMNRKGGGDAEETMDDIVTKAHSGLLSADEIAQYRRDGYVVARGLLGLRMVEACRKALSDLAADRVPKRQTGLMFEKGYRAEDIAPEQRERYVRKYMDFVEDSPVLEAAAMHRRLHAILDQLLGSGRVLFQEMALVKPPRIGADKPWHQDASYFRITDPGLVVGTWIALDPALRNNGCMEVIPGSHLLGPVPHVHENDFNRCRIDDRHVDPARALQIEMQPGDALIFQSLLQHFTAPNASDLTRRAIQFHYHQTGAVWGSVADHRRLYHDAAGGYAGCTVPHEPTPPGFKHFYRDGLIRPVVPMDEIA